MVNSLNRIEQAALNMTNLKALPTGPIKVDIGTVVESDKNGVQSMYSAVNKINTLGYIPIVSMGIGTFRIVINIIDAIRNIAKTFFFQSPIQSVKNLGNNIIEIVRGVIEMVPFAGNLVIYAIDQIRIKAIESEIKQNIQKQKAREYYGSGIRDYYANGKLVYSSMTNYSNLEDSMSMTKAGFKFA